MAMKVLMVKTGFSALLLSSSILHADKHSDMQDLDDVRD
jgi:hypothetical protein